MSDLKKHVPLTEEQLNSMPMKEVFNLVAEIEAKSKECVEDLNIIHQFFNKNTLVKR